MSDRDRNYVMQARYVDLLLRLAERRTVSHEFFDRIDLAFVRLARAERLYKRRVGDRARRARRRTAA